MLKMQIYAGLALLCVGGIILARAYWINEGKTRCANAAIYATQEKVIENDKKLRTVRANRPSANRVADRLLRNTF